MISNILVPLNGLMLALVALVGIWLAGRQMVIAQQRLQHDIFYRLFDMRFEVYKATREFFKSQKLKAIPEYGPLSWSVPGCVSGWDELHQKFGKLPMTDILGATIEYANDGFPVTEVIAEGWAKSKVKLSKSPDAFAQFRKLRLPKAAAQ